MPASITMCTPSTVSDVSAMSVERTTRRRPDALGRRAASCSAKGSAPANRTMSTCGGVRSCKTPCARFISPIPGRNTRMSPSSLRSACRTASPIEFSRRSSRCFGMYLMSTGKVRPSDVTTGASPKESARTCENNSAWAVADMARIFTSESKVLIASRRNAKPRSVGTLRSCTSSKMTRPVPSSVGSFCKRLVKMPSVTTSMRVDAPMRRSSRV